MKNTDNSGPSEYTELTTATKSDHHSLINSNGQTSQTETACDYEVPHSHKLIKYDRVSKAQRLF